jgi:8-oxo-dGTP pyrophosphatase MutT (NUDIX family)
MTPMAKDLAVFLARHEPVRTDEAEWWGGEIRLQVDSYLTADAPPISYVVSVRSVVFRGDKVLTMHNADGWHVLPGGRREPGETLEQTVRREVMEEAGLSIQRPVPLGFNHLHHLTPRPRGYPPDFLYPDFLAVVFLSGAGRVNVHAKLADDYEDEAVFRTVKEARGLQLPIDIDCFLSGALQVRRGTQC